MRRRPYPIVEVTGGLDVGKDPIHLEDANATDLECVRYHKNTIKKDFAFQAVANVANERIMGFHTYKQYDGDQYTICCGVDKAYRLNGANWANISGANAVFTGDSSNNFSMCTFNNMFIVTNNKDAIQTWDGANWANLGGSPPSTAKFLTPFYSRLVLGNTYESAVRYPLRLRWSIAGDPANWTGTGSGAIDIIDTQDAITGLIRLGDRLFVLKEDTIWEAYYVGGTDVFKVRLITNDIGCRCGRTAVSVGAYIFFVGTNNIYQFDGATFTPIGTPLLPLIFESATREVDFTVIEQAHAIFDYESGQYVVVLPTISGTEPELVLKYSPTAGVWTKRTRACTAMGYKIESTVSYSGTPWANANGNWNSNDWGIPWRDEIEAIGFPTIMYGDANGTVVEDDKQTAANETLIWSSKDFIFAHSQRITEVRYLCKGGVFFVQYSYDQGVSWTDQRSITPTNDSFTDVVDHLNVTKEFLRVKITASNAFEMKWLEPWFIERKRPL